MPSLSLSVMVFLSNFAWVYPSLHFSLRGQAICTSAWRIQSVWCAVETSDKICKNCIIKCRFIMLLVYNNCALLQDTFQDLFLFNFLVIKIYIHKKYEWDCGGKVCFCTQNCFLFWQHLSNMVYCIKSTEN